MRDCDSCHYGTCSTSYPEAKGGDYPWIHGSRFPYHQYNSLDLDFYGSIFCPHRYILYGYPHKNPSMSSGTRTRCNQPYILLRNLTPRECADGEAIYVAPRWHHGNNIYWEYFRSDTRLVHPHLCEQLARGIFSPNVLRSLNDSRILTHSHHRSTDHSDRHEVTYLSFFSLPLELSRRLDSREDRRCIRWMAALCWRVHPYLITLDASVSQYIRLSDPHISCCIRRNSDSSIPYWCIPPSRYSILVF